MTSEEQRGRAAGGFDPEAEQEVDFARYARLLAVRWWLLAAGLVIGALIGYGVSAGGTQVYSATATVYLGQPYSASGNIVLQTLQNNPGAVRSIVHSNAVIAFVARRCKAKPRAFRDGIATQSVPGALSRSGQNPIVRISVDARKAKTSACAANGLAERVVAKTSVYADRKIANFRSQIAADSKQIDAIQTAISSPDVSTTDKLLFQLQLKQLQNDKLNAGQLMLQAKQVEQARVLTGAVSQRVTARSRRNTVVVAALIGLVLGGLTALFWDRLAPRLAFRNGE